MALSRRRQVAAVVEDTEGTFGAKQITIGAITSGPFLAGEVVDGGSNKQGLVLRNTADGETTLVHADIAGKSPLENSLSLTGLTSGATATTSSGQSAYTVLTGSDSGFFVYDLATTPEITSFDRNPITDTLSRLPGITARKSMRVRFRTELAGHGNATVPNYRPKYHALFLGAGFTDLDVLAVTDAGTPTGASGTFQHGETVTQAGSNATGVVYTDQAASDVVTAQKLLLTNVTGTFAISQTITGGTSNATVTTSATGTTQPAYAVTYKPDVSSRAISLGVYDDPTDGVIKGIKGCRGNVTCSARVEEIAFLDFEFLGVIQSVVDGSALTGVTFPSADPSIFQGVNFLYDVEAGGGGKPYAIGDIDFESFTFNMQNTLNPRLSANETGGAKSYKITDRNPQGTIDPELRKVADFDIYNDLFNGLSGPMSFNLGSGAGNIVEVFIPNARYTGATETDRNGILAVQATFGAFRSSVTAAGDDEVYFTFR